MLQLHDAMKADQDYQRRAEQVVHDFPAGSTWVCYTDQVSHAALAGQHQFEQTFRLPVARMHDAETSPLRVLERMAGRNWRDGGHVFSSLSFLIVSMLVLSRSSFAVAASILI